MAYWEFLLQKEGDHDWLPLETAHVEISEGRYRIIAHTSYCDTDVNIRLSRLLTEQMPPRKKSLKRIGTTNPSGLMVVIPFTHLTPGHWTVTCSAHGEAADAWEFGVQLQVLAIESGSEYWETERDEAVLAEQLTSQASTVTIDDGFQAMPPASAASEWSGQGPQAAASFTPQTAIADLPLRLQLQHQALVAQNNAPLTLPGQVTTFSQVEGLVGEGTLAMQLRNPETGTVVHQTTQALSIAKLPSRFELSITPPATPNTRLLVGELSLWTAANPPQVLAIQGFTITLNLDALLESVANQAEQSTTASFDDLTETATADDGATAAASDADTSDSKDGIVTPLSPRSVPFRLIYLPANGLTLPPVIYQPLDKKTVGAPTLPAFLPGRDRAGDHDSETSELPTPPAKSLTLPPLGAAAKGGDKVTNQATEPAIANLEPTAPAESPVELPNFGNPPAAPSGEPEASASLHETKAQSSSPPAFEPDLQGRFWERLSALAAEAQKTAADYQAQLEAAGVDAAETTTVPDEAIADAAASQAPINYEVVVYEPEAPPIVNLPEGDREPIIEVLPPGEPEQQELGDVPVPSWNLPTGELLAGTPLPLTIRLPAYPQRLAVKVWVTDVQSRTLVDRPRWLMNWNPSPEENEQTAFLQLQVPLGSIEARFEAIAIDLATQQESYKISEVRSIIPSDLPETGVDEAL
ncbi:MAG: hypothetical protein AAF609_16090 [Cyanobacteria bacterium P01_C01_bin.120]